MTIETSFLRIGFLLLLASLGVALVRIVALKAALRAASPRERLASDGVLPQVIQGPTAAKGSPPGQPVPAVPQHERADLLSRESRFGKSEWLAWSGTALALAAMTVSLTARAIRTGHGPFTGMYEFAIAFVWGILLMSLYFAVRYRQIALNAAGQAVSLALLLYANSLNAQASPLMPALQNSLLLSAHVLSAVIAYGAFTVGFISAVFYMLQSGGRLASLPGTAALEQISHHSVIIGFPFMTLVIVLGAIWADIAWGRYWAWDPKETASLVTWLLYAGYLHTRSIKGWRGRKSAILLIVGFIAVIFTFFGNMIFNGLHAYG